MYLSKRKREAKGDVEPPKKRRAENPIKIYLQTKAKLRTDPDTLIGRETERRTVNTFWKEHITDQTPGSMYISGAPGCGKTTLLREQQAYFTNYEEENNIPKSTVMYLNCMHLEKKTDNLFKYLCEAFELPPVASKKISHEDQLRKFLSAPRPSARRANTNATSTARSRRAAPKPAGMIVLIADEIDRLITADNHVLYSLFELSGLKNSKLILIAIANKLDLTDHTLPRLRNSHCEPITLHFAPYSALQISAIIQSRLNELPPESQIVDVDSINYCASKVSAQSADVRNALEYLRASVQYVQDKYQEECDNSHEPVSLKRVTVLDVNTAFDRSTSHAVELIKGLPQQQKTVLCAVTLLALQKKTKITITNVIDACKTIPFAKLMKKPEIIQMLAQLAEQSIISEKTNNLKIDESDVKFAFEDTPFAAILDI